MAEIKRPTVNSYVLRIQCVSSRTNLFRQDIRIRGIRLSIGATIQMVNFLINSELLKTLIFPLIFWDITLLLAVAAPEGEDAEEEAVGGAQHVGAEVQAGDTAVDCLACRGAAGDGDGVGVLEDLHDEVEWERHLLMLYVRPHDVPVFVRIHIYIYTTLTDTRGRIRFTHISVMA
jgi:hypothetical protein